MKNIPLFLLFVLSSSFLNNLKAQVLYTETFDNFTLGNLGTDVTGTTPGQGGWYTLYGLNTNYKIITEANRGKVLSMFIDNPKNEPNVYAEKRNLSTLIDQRTPGNNVIKMEIDFYIGTLNSPSNDNHNVSNIYLLFDPPQNHTGNQRELMGTYYNYKNNLLRIDGFDGTHLMPIKNPYSPLTANTWYTFIFYLDYTNQKCYFEIPGKNYARSGAFLNVANPFDYKLSKIGFIMAIFNLQGDAKREQRYDNIKITALKAVPPHLLSADSFLAEKFNLYPNPATNVVNITNSENMLVEEVAIYDTTGKKISTQSFNNEKEIQLNVENLTSGTYMLYLQTNQGLAVKKLVKN